MSQRQRSANTSHSSDGLSRRGFVAGAGAAAVAFFVMKPALVRGYAANEKVDPGIIGCGGRGTWVTDLLKQHGGGKNMGPPGPF